MTCPTQDLTILQGKTFTQVIRWEALPLIYKSITAISKAGPVGVTATGHGIPDGWRAAVVSAGGMRQINAEHWPLWDSDLHQVTVVNSNTVQFNDTDSEKFSTYTSGGSLVYYTPVDLTGFTARMQIRDTVDATTVLLSLTTTNGRIALDTALYTITLTVSATDTAALTFLTGVYDLELVSGTGVVTRVMSGNVIVTQEVTR